MKTLHLGKGFALVLVCLLMLRTQSLSSLSYSYYFNDTTGAGNPDPTSNGYYFPAYSLGTLDKNFTLEFTFNIPSSAVVFDPTEIALFYTFQGAMLPAETATGTLSFATDGVLDADQTTFKLSYTVFFADATIASAPFKLLVGSTTLDPTQTSTLTYFNILVTYFNSSVGQVAGSGSPPATLLKVTETFRQTTLKFLYVGSKTKINFSFFPISFLEGNPFAPQLYAVGGVTATNDWTFTTGLNLFPVLSNE
jgi:hypothetical protein